MTTSPHQNQNPEFHPTQTYEPYPSKPSIDPVSDGVVQPVGESSLAKQPVQKGDKRILLTGAGIVAGVIALGAPFVYSDGQPTAAPAPGIEQAQPASDAAVEKANETARDLANGIIKILAKPGSGAEAYRGDMVGNKTAVIGPDGKYPSADDNNTPESFVGFDPIAGEMYFSSVQGYFPNGIKHEEDFESTLVRITFKVAKENPIYDAKGQLQLTDYEQAMSQPDTLELKSMEASLHAGIDPAPEVSVAENEAGKLQATVYENGQFDDYPGKSEATQGDEQFDGVAARADQVAEAALEDLQNSMK